MPKTHADTSVQLLGSGSRAADVHAAAKRAIATSAQELPHREKIETAVGRDLSHINAHVGGDAEIAARDAGAEALATGVHVVLPANPSLETTTHEVVHTLQQGAGVQLKDGIGEVGDAYEREANAVADRTVAGETAALLVDKYPAQSSIGAAPIQRKPDLPKGQDTPPAGPYVEAIEDAVAGDSPDATSAAPIQRKPGDKKREYIPFKIIVSHDMTGEEFITAANLQVFGVAQVSSDWKNVKGRYTAAESPVEIGVEVSLLRRVRGAINAHAGLDTDASGKVAGADVRAKDFLSRPASEEKTALLAEIDRRYYARSGATPGTPIKPGDAGNRELWNSIRDEVLFQDEYIVNLPDKVKVVIRVSIRGRELTPADYDQLFRIAKKIAALPPGMAADYAAKITDSTTDLNIFETAVDAYRTDVAERGKEDQERTTVQNKLLGLDEVHKLYKRYVAASVVDRDPHVSATKQVLKDLGGKVETASDLKQQLEQQLTRYGFASIEEFATYIDRFVHSFEEGAVRITLDILARYAGKLYKEQQRYQDPAVIKDLHGKLGGFRAEYREFESNAAAWNAYAKKANDDNELGRLPGNGHIHRQPPTAEQAAAHDKAIAAKANAQSQIQGLSKEYPIFAEDELPVDKRLDKAKLAQADETTLGSVLLAHIAERQQIVTDARDQLRGKHQLIYKMDKLMPTFFAEMDIQPGSIHEEILKDKMREDAITKIVGGILLAIVAVALTVVSLGAATPAVIAAGASIGAAGLSTYMAYEEYKEYTSEHAMAEAGLAEDPSKIWLVLAIVGAGVDMAAAVKAVRALGPAVKALEEGGNLKDFTKAVKAREASKQLERKTAEAVEKAAAAREAYQAAKGEFGQALSKAYSFPGPLVDPEVYRAVMKMAVAKIREGGHSLAAFIAELKQVRLAAKLGDLTPEELVKVKQAWEEAEALAKSAESPVDLVDDFGEVFGRYQHGSQLEVISKKKLYGGNTIKLDENATTTITGTLDDTDSIARRGIKLPGATVMGENPGGLNILRSPKWGEIKLKYQPLLESQGESAYWKAVTDEFWETVNKPWLDEAIARGDAFRFVSNPNDEKSLFVLSKNKKSFVLDNGKKIQSIFGREVEYLKSKGYTIRPDGTAVKVE